MEPRSNFPDILLQRLFLRQDPPPPPGRGPVASLPLRDFASALGSASGLAGRGVLAAPSVWPSGWPSELLQEDHVLLQERKKKDHLILIQVLWTAHGVSHSWERAKENFLITSKY